MNPAEYWKAIRRRWMDVVLAVVVAVAAGWAVTRVAPPGPPTTTYEATAVVIQTGNPYSPGNVTNLEAVAAFGTIGEVPKRVDEAIAYEGEPQELVARIEVDVEREAGVLRFTTLSTDAQEAVALVNAFANETRDYIAETQGSSAAAERRTLQDRIDRIQTQIAELNDQIDQAPPDEAAVLEEDRNSLIRTLGLVSDQFYSLGPTLSVAGGLDVIEAEAAVPQSSGGLQAPQSTLARLIIAGLLGLVAGVVLVLILDRFDSRIRTRAGAEKAFGLPVLAEIPYIKRRKRRSSGIVTLSEPRSHAADAFRIVTTLLTIPTTAEVSGNGHGNGHPPTFAATPMPPSKGGAVQPPRTAGPAGLPPPAIDAEELPSPPSGPRERGLGSGAPRTILVTSPGPDDGKTTVVANLAAAFAARGARTVVFSCDLRRPYIHKLLRADNSVGLADVLAGGDRWANEIPISKTRIDRVRLVPSGQPPPDPGELLASPRMRSILQTVASQADVVLVDTAPILTTSDAVPLVGMVDAVLVVARSGRTTLETASRTAELLRRLDADLRGVMLNAVTESALPRRYYYNRYYKQVKVQKPRKGKGFSRSRASQEEPVGSKVVESVRFDG